MKGMGGRGGRRDGCGGRERAHLKDGDAQALDTSEGRIHPLAERGVLVELVELGEGRKERLEDVLDLPRGGSEGRR